MPYYVSRPQVCGTSWPTQWVMHQAVGPTHPGCRISPSFECLYFHRPPPNWESAAAACAPTKADAHPPSFAHGRPDSPGSAILSLMLPACPLSDFLCGQNPAMEHLYPTEVSKEKITCRLGNSYPSTAGFLGDEILVIFIHSIMLFITGIFSLP